MAAEVGEARKAWQTMGRGEELRFETPVDFNRFRRETQERVFEWLSSL